MSPCSFLRGSSTPETFFLGLCRGHVVSQDPLAFWKDGALVESATRRRQGSDRPRSDTVLR